MAPPRTRLTVDYTDGNLLGPSDPRAAMARSVQVGRALVGRINASNADEPTPCAAWTVGDIARHLIAVLDRAAAGPSGVVVDEMPVLAGVEIDALEGALAASAQRLEAAWADDAKLQQTITVPWGTFSGAETIGTYAAEVLLHGWDIAVSIGVEPNWPEPDTSIHYEVAQIAFPGEGRGDHSPFRDATPPLVGASTIERLAAWMGRDTGRWCGLG